MSIQEKNIYIKTIALTGACDKLHFEVFLLVGLNQFHEKLVIILTLYKGKVRVKSSRNLGNEISTFMEYIYYYRRK